MRKIILISLMILMMVSSITSSTFANYTVTIDDLTADIYAKQFEFIASGKLNFDSDTLKIAPEETVPFVFQIANFSDSIQSEVKMTAVVTITVNAAEGKSSIGNLEAKVFGIDYDTYGNTDKTFLFNMNLAGGEGSGKLTYYFPLEQTAKQFEVDVTWVSGDDDNDYSGEDFGNTLSVSVTATQNNHANLLDYSSSYNVSNNVLVINSGALIATAPTVDTLSQIIPKTNYVASNAALFLSTFQGFLQNFSTNYPEIMLSQDYFKQSATLINWYDTPLSSRPAQYLNTPSTQFSDYIVLARSGATVNSDIVVTSYDKTNCVKAAVAHRYVAELGGLDASLDAIKTYFVKTGDTYTYELTDAGKAYYAALAEASVKFKAHFVQLTVYFQCVNPTGTDMNLIKVDGHYLVGAVYVKDSACAALAFADGNVIYNTGSNTIVASQYYPQCYSGSFTYGT